LVKDAGYKSGPPPAHPVTTTDRRKDDEVTNWETGCPPLSFDVYCAVSRGLEFCSEGLEALQDAAGATPQTQAAKFRELQAIRARVRDPAA
jgi:hypothetical protein